VSETARVLLYSSDANVRRDVRVALGKQVAPDLPEIEVVEVATHPEVFRQLDAGGYALAILDGEANPAGGIGIAYQIKEELDSPPPVLLLVVRVADAWLATWSRAEAVAPLPIDPLKLPGQVAQLLRLSQPQVNA
jgi:DNA-binding response OmpR family regulator